MSRALCWAAAAAVALAGSGCGASRPAAKSVTGVQQTKATVRTGADGLTNEQRNIKERLEQENAPGAVKHLYVFSSYSGQCLLYSTVRGKVTSSGKRLSPTSVGWVNNTAVEGGVNGGVAFDLNGRTAVTKELIQDDGTYGSSIEYLYWFDAGAGGYRQFYLSGGVFVVVSSTPLTVKSVTVRVEEQRGERE